MRAVTSCCLAVLLIGCGKSAEKSADAEVGAADAMDETPAGISMADLAGTWNIRSKLEGSDKEITYDLVASGDGSSWTVIFPGRKPIPARVVATGGDSVVWESGPFESVIRKGVTVKTSRVTAHLQNGKLTGKTTAVYDARGADTVAHLTVEGTRAP
jgi:hypothetical protein